MKKRICNIWLTLAVCLVLVTPVSATIIIVEVTGVVNSVETVGGLALDDLVSIGSAMTGLCTYDTETPVLGSGSYAIISISMTIGNYTFTHDPMSPDPPLFRVHTVDPGYFVRSDAARFDGTVTINGLGPLTYDDITWDWTYLALLVLGTSSGEYIPTDALPDLDSWPDLSIFDVCRGFETRFSDESNGYFDIYGEVTSLNVVPEPATVLLLALGGLALLKRRRA